MRKTNKVKSVSNKLTTKTDTEAAPSLGRKRDAKLDATILGAAIDVLADHGFDGMTMDMVAARAKAGKTSLYRRWPSKTELVREALTWMNRSQLELNHLPDTGALRGDLLALVKPQSIEEGQRKLRVIAGLGSFFSQQPQLAEGGESGIFHAWEEANRKLIHRAMDRGELPAHAEVDLACKVMTSMVSFRGLIQRKSVDRTFFAALIDGIILPALKNRPIARVVRR